MIDNVKNSKNIGSELESAVICLRRQEGIVIAQENGENIAVYPFEFLSETSAKRYLPAKSEITVKLAKRAGLLPSLATIPPSRLTEEWPVFAEIKLKEQLAAVGAEVVETARAKLPIKGAENSQIISFRSEGDDAVHLALIIGEKNSDAPLVRVHSSCVTGDLLGSLRCDCGGQLQLALAAIKESGYGILLYMNQEGRGIGITNKLRAYGLQEQGMDTYEANHALGFESDERDFAAAGAMLKALDISKINLLSNNPHKVSELRKGGIIISKRVPLVAETSRHNKAYIAAKSSKAGHIID